MPPPLSHPLQDALHQAIAERGGVRHFPANAVLVHEDDVSDSLYILLSGRAKVYGSSGSGSTTFATPLSSAMICCVRSATRAASSVGSA